MQAGGEDARRRGAGTGARRASSFVGVDALDFKGPARALPEALRRQLRERSRRIGSDAIRAGASPGLPRRSSSTVGAVSYRRTSSASPRARARRRHQAGAQLVRALVVVAAALALAAPAAACDHARDASRSSRRSSSASSCHTTLDESNSPFANQMKADRGTSDRRVSDRAADPRRDGRAVRHGGALDAADARLRPDRVVAAARRNRARRGGDRRRRLALVARGAAAASRPAAGPRSIRTTSGWSTRSSPGSMIEKLPIAFLAGLVSVVTPCVLPLVPGYLSAVSARRGRPPRRARRRRGGSCSRACRSSSASRWSSSLLGAGAAAIGSAVDKPTQLEIAGFVLVVLGLAFMGLLPWPERAVAPGLLQRARRPRLERAARRRVRGVRGAVHRHGARVDPRARVSSRDRSCAAVVLLVAYSLGLGAAFVARRHRVRARDERVPLGARPLRRRPDRAQARRSSRSGCCSSSTATGGCGSPSTRCSRRSGSARSSRGEQRARRRGRGARGANGAEPPERLHPLALCGDRLAAARLVRGDDDMHEPLEEVALARLGTRATPSRTPRALRSTHRARASCEASLGRLAATVLGVAIRHGDDPAVWGRPLHPWEARGAPAGAPLRDGGRGRAARSRDRGHRAHRRRRTSRTPIRTSRFSATRTTPTPPGCAARTPPDSTRSSRNPRSSSAPAN